MMEWRKKHLIEIYGMCDRGAHSYVKANFVVRCKQALRIGPDAVGLC